MTDNVIYSGKLDSVAEELFIDLFCSVFGPKNTKYLYTQYPFVDIYGGRRYIDFAIKLDSKKIAVEIDGETYHNPNRVSDSKYYDDLLKQNSMSHDEWYVFRWTYNQLKKYPEKTKDEILTFFGELPIFQDMEDYLPKQKGKIIELKDHQEEALKNLEEMRKNNETIGLLYHATGERVIIVMGAVCVIKSRVSGTLNKCISCIA